LPDAGLLLTLPAQSVIVRLLLGGVVAVIVARLLLRAGLRVPGIRVITALLPATVLLVILVVSVGDYRLPGLMAPSADSGSVLVPIANTYAYLAPVAVPALVSAWALVTLLRLVNRLQGAWRFSRDAARTAAASSVPLEVRCTVRRVAARMGLDAPPVALASACPGGASVIGFRRPTVVLDADLVDRLDPLELEGVVAHELAHVQRRDNLMALLLSVTRDLLFFVPGGRWALRQLLVERERAADDLAIQTTQRPGALAGGLLKVLESAGHRHACAALLPAGTLVDRVQLLVDAPPAPSRRRRVGRVHRGHRSVCGGRARGHRRAADNRGIGPGWGARGPADRAVNGGTTGCSWPGTRTSRLRDLSPCRSAHGHASRSARCRDRR
jgi:beta-lactamase regulating signal transducer with metallopeptidase domain